MDVRVLRYFLAVAREENITRAADYLHIAQPSLSVQLKDLEKELGKTLLIRGKRKISLTEDGVLLRKRAEEIISLVEKTKREISIDNTNDITGEISIGSGETEAMKVAIQAAAKISTEYPGIHYHLFSGDAEAIMERLDNGLLDFGIIMEPVDLTKYERIQLPVTDIWGIVMLKDCPLSTKSYIEPTDLFPLSIIAPERIGLHREFSNWLHQDFQNLNIVATYNLAYNASLLVNFGFGYAMTLNKLIYTGQDSNLCFRPLHPNLESRLCIVWKKYQVFSKASEYFIKTLKSQLD